MQLVRGIDNADTDVATGLSITPGAGTYLVWFSSSVEGSADAVIRVSIYAGTNRIGASERRFRSEGSIVGTPVPIATQATVTVGASEAITVQWQTSATTASMHERTLTVLRL